MLKVPAYHILDFFCFRRKDTGVCIRNMSRQSVTCLCRDSEVLGAHEVWDWAALRDFSGHRPESKGPRSYSAPSPCSRAPKLHPCLRSYGEKVHIYDRGSVNIGSINVKKGSCWFLVFLKVFSGRKKPSLCWEWFISFTALAVTTSLVSFACCSYCYEMVKGGKNDRDLPYKVLWWARGFCHGQGAHCKIQSKRDNPPA